ncbi:energy transducer TonB [Pseudoxanthomonas putridarboris]|uniref:Energy transducer TonB n=1 Tax=Pseudoxanthomonas putridarboris TaxID=752605 RepID=A0ABU9IZB0_9GAMM
MSASQQPRDPHFVFRLPRRALIFAALAFGIGLLLFVIVWWVGRDDGFYKPETTVAGANQPVEALPEPLPSGDGASGMDEPPARPADDRPTLVEERPMPAPVQDAPGAPAAPVAPAAPLPAGVALAPGEVPVPVPGQTPAPQYPSAAMRRGTEGTVMVRVQVGADGVPLSVEVQQRSGSRDLDRAAVEAVRRWRFQPAQRDGQPVVGSVTIPIDFKLR